MCTGWVGVGFLLTILLTKANYSLGIFCYVCGQTEATANDCKDPYTPMTSHLQECTGTQNFCIKEKGLMDEIGEKVERNCKFLTMNRTKCFTTRRVQDDKSITLCACANQDGCNSTPSPSITHRHMLVFLLQILVSIVISTM